MNKRLRRLWRKKQSSRDNASLQQNTNGTPTFPSLLTGRSSAKPNFYYRTGNSVQDERELKKNDAISDDKNILIVEDAKDELANHNSGVELNLEPMNKETVTIQENPIPNERNFVSDLDHDSNPTADTLKDKLSHSAQSITVPSPVDHENLDTLLPSKSQKNKNPYSPSPLTMPVFKSNGERENNSSAAEKRTSRNPNPSSKSSFRESKKNKPSNMRSTQSTSEILNLFINPAVPSQFGTSQYSPTFEMAEATSCPPKPSFSFSSTKIPSRNFPKMEKLKSPSGHEDLMRARPQNTHIPEIIPSILPRVPERDIRWLSSQNNCTVHHPDTLVVRGEHSRSFTPNRNSQFASHHYCCNKMQHQHHHPHHHQTNMASSWNVPVHHLDHFTSHCMHKHGHATPCHSAFTRSSKCSCSGHCCAPPRHNFSLNECCFPVKKQVCQLCYLPHCSCALQSCSETPEPIPVIVISFPGETHNRTIELSRSSFSEEDCVHPQCQLHLHTFQAGKLNLEEICCADYKLHCERSQQMAPSVTFLSSLQETRNFTSHCPCCHQIIHQHHPSFEEERKMSTNHFATHSYLNCDNASNAVQNALGHFEISSRSYSKLLAYIESTRLAAKKHRSPVSHFASRSSFHGLEHRSFSPNSELVFLNRKPIHASNEYSTLGEQMLNSSIYQNQTIADTVQLAQVLERVENCSWYWGEISNVEAKQILHGSPIGTFVLRDSSDPRYLFSMSVMTSRGPTSIRVVYVDGYFRFDSDGDKTNSRVRKPSVSNEFTEIPKHRQCVVHMILHYTSHLSLESQQSTQNVNLRTKFDSSASSSGEISESLTDVSKNKEQCQFMCSWMGRSGKKVMPVSISQPLNKNKPLSLKHLSRVCINKHIGTWKYPQNVQRLPLSSSLQKYVKKYPYPV